MRELCSYGSVGEPAGNCRLYPEPTLPHVTGLMTQSTKVLARMGQNTQ